MFCEAIVQAVLLHGSETWAVTPIMLKVLDSFHHPIGRHITGKMLRLVAGKWMHSPLAKALEKAGLCTISAHT